MGIFRLPGQASRIQAMKELYDSGSQQDFPISEDVHTVASLFKLYLRELPEPVVPFTFYQSYNQALEGTCTSSLNAISNVAIMQCTLQESVGNQMQQKGKDWNS